VSRGKLVRGHPGTVHFLASACTTLLSSVHRKLLFILLMYVATLALDLRARAHTHTHTHPHPCTDAHTHQMPVWFTEFVGNRIEEGIAYGGVEGYFRMSGFYNADGWYSGPMAFGIVWRDNYVNNGGYEISGAVADAVRFLVVVCVCRNGAVFVFSSHFSVLASWLTVTPPPPSHTHTPCARTSLALHNHNHDRHHHHHHLLHHHHHHHHHYMLN
jgi:hypothetical protein